MATSIGETIFEASVFAASVFLLSLMAAYIADKFGKK